jgi:Arc/MetJ-type ribon-helix-helix transcriptional regulator
MSTQIAVRLPDDVVAFLDREVSQRRAPSRAAVVLRALERERRRQTAARDAAILAATEPDHDLDELAEYSAKPAYDID